MPPNAPVPPVPIWIAEPHSIIGSTRLLARFLDMVQIDTQADPHSTSSPSTACQLDLARYLVEELRSLGLVDAALDQHGYVYATFPGRVPGPIVGLIAHMDTAPAFSGKHVHPVAAAALLPPAREDALDTASAPQ